MIKILKTACTIFLLYAQVLHSQYAPVTTAGRITDAVPGDPSVPVAVTVTGFTNIGQLTLTMVFDTTRVHFVSASTNPSLSGMTVTYTHPSGNTTGKLVLSWTGATDVSLSDGSYLANLTFSYVTGTGILSWAYTFGSVCQYKRRIGGVLTALSDTPRYLYYLNGGISDRSAPVTSAPYITKPEVGPLPVPVIVNGFSNIGGVTLYLEYDPAVITFQHSFEKNPAFDSNFLVGDSPAPGSKRQIVIQWFGSALNLDNGSNLCTLDFNYPVAICSTCFLSWFDNGSSCEFADGSGDVLIDMPQVDYYVNGLVGPGLPATWTGNINSAWDNAGNWSECGLPDITRDIVIPDVSPNSFPVINLAGYCRSISIETGATLTIGASGSLIISNN